MKILLADVLHRDGVEPSQRRLNAQHEMAENLLRYRLPVTVNLQSGVDGKLEVQVYDDAMVVHVTAAAARCLLSTTLNTIEEESGS